MTRASSSEASQEGFSAKAGHAKATRSDVAWAAATRERRGTVRGVRVAQVGTRDGGGTHWRNGSRVSSIYRPKNGAPEMLRLLYLFAMAVLTVACAGISGPGRGLAVRNTPVELAVVTGANAALSASPPDSPLAAEWRESAARPAVFREAVEADVNDDDRDTRSELAEVPAVAFGSVWIPRKPRRAWRGEPQSDTSRFALRRGFPRGPPT